MKRVGYVYDPFMSNHESPGTEEDAILGEKHPEQPDRIHRIYQELLNRGFISKMKSIKSRMATKDELLLGHTEKYLDTIVDDLSNPKLIASKLEKYNSVYANEYTLQCALLAAGSTITIVDEILNGNIDRGVAIVRPPGHHCTVSEAMGFCFFNNVSLAAIKARNAGLKVAIFDWDVHYGNGTADIVACQDNINFFSIHRHDNGKFYPGTGYKSQHPNIFNYPLNYSKGDDQVYLGIFNDHIIPKLQEIKPNLIIVSAGFDCAEGDPLGGYHVSPKGFRKMTELLLSVQPKLVLVLEGGYNLDDISKSMASCVEALFI